MRKLCEVCNDEYTPKSNNTKYCSVKCRNEVYNSVRRGEIRNLVCPICNANFETTNSKKIYCSNECNIEAKQRRNRKPQINKKCRVCDELFLVEGRSRNSIYCSEDCKKKDWKRNYVEKLCPNCDQKFVGDKRQTCCSKECSYEYSRKVIKLECEICSNEFHVYPSRLNREIKPKYCSEECYRESRRTGVTPNCKCDNCDKPRYKAPSLLEKHKYTFCSYECMGEYYEKNELFSGTNSGTYIGSFDTHGKYYGSNWRSQRRKARERDNYTCQSCGIHEIEYGKELSVHHKIPFVMFDDYLEANDIDNLISVCEPCHRKIHSGDNHHTKFEKTYENN